MGLCIFLFSTTTDLEISMFHNLVPLEYVFAPRVTTPSLSDYGEPVGFVPAPSSPIKMTALFFEKAKKYSIQIMNRKKHTM